MEITRKKTFEAGPETKISKGDILDFEGTKWRVLDKNEKDYTAFIMKITNIESMSFGDNNDYENSDVRKYIRSDEFRNTIPDELGEVIISEFELLTVEQIEQYLPNKVDRIVLDEEGWPVWWWTATHYPHYAYFERYVNTSGALNYGGAFNSGGVVPACYIRHL